MPQSVNPKNERGLTFSSGRTIFRKSGTLPKA
jgi:hypothetical protein